MKTQANISFEDLCDRYEECYEYVRDASDLLKRFKGVLGVGIGPKTSAGSLLPEQPCFLVYVQEKKSRIDLEARELIPKEILGIRTDVVAVGSRATDSHNEVDARWLALSSEGFVSLCIPNEESYRQLS